jgi:hypothetical protein
MMSRALSQGYGSPIKSLLKAKRWIGRLKNQEMYSGNSSCELCTVSFVFLLTSVVRILESILEFVEGQVGRNKIFRMLHSMADAGKIQEYRERLAVVISQFEVSPLAFVIYPLNPNDAGGQQDEISS